jgi:YidC/Oxa1 family membrane protein insertase
VNPLAGLVPSLVQVPVFVGLYRAALLVKKENTMDEAFLLLPSLRGPTNGAARTSDRLSTKGIGRDTVAFLVIPIVLVVSQWVSTNVEHTTKDPTQQSAH